MEAVEHLQSALLVGQQWGRTHLAELLAKALADAGAAKQDNHMTLKLLTDMKRKLMFVPLFCRSPLKSPLLLRRLSCQTTSKKSMCPQEDLRRFQSIVCKKRCVVFFRGSAPPAATTCTHCGMCSPPPARANMHTLWISTNILLPSFPWRKALRGMWH